MTHGHDIQTDSKHLKTLSSAGCNQQRS